MLLDVEEYEALVDQVELLRDVQTAERQLKRGENVSNAKARKKIQARFRK